VARRWVDVRVKDCVRDIIASRGMLIYINARRRPYPNEIQVRNDRRVRSLAAGHSHPAVAEESWIGTAELISTGFACRQACGCPMLTLSSDCGSSVEELRP
jgi:hypothetical protein